MKINIIRIASFILLLAMATTMIGCSNPNNEITDLIDGFETACNELDFNGVIDRIDPKISKKLKVATGIVGLFTNATTDELFTSLANWMISDYDVGADFFESIEIDINHINMTGNRANVSAVISFDMAGNFIEEDATFICTKHSEKWYISDFTIH